MLMHTRLWATVLLLGLPAAVAAEDGWVALLGKGAELRAWKSPAKEWVVGGDAVLDAKSPRMLAAQKGEGVLVNCPPGHARDLVTSDIYQDLEVHVEFMLGQGSNSGVKLMGLYEIQLL